jgi:hypothetical protein
MPYILFFATMIGLLVGMLYLISWLKKKDRDLSAHSAVLLLPLLVLLFIVAVLLIQCKGESKCNHKPLIKMSTKPYCTKNRCIGPPSYEPLTRIVVYERGYIPNSLLKACPHAPIIVVKGENEVECKYHKTGIPEDFRRRDP